jgi:high-affinity iron transporter
VHLLDYISVDYPEFVQGGNVLDAAEYAEQLEFAGQVLALLRQLPEHERQVELIRQAEALVSLIWRKEDGAHVAALGTALRWDLIKTYHVTVAPQRAPDVQAVHTLYEENCAQCHGLQGHGDGPQAAGLDPPPSNFHDRTRMAQRSVYSLYSTITLGVAGTAMASFAALSEEERWALAFYISTFATTDAEKTRGAELWRYGTGKDLFPDLGRLATTTVADIVRRHGEAGVSVFAYLRGNPSLLTAGGKSPLAFSLRTLSESLETYRRGNRQAAQQLAVTAYLEGFELVETSLDAVDHELRTQVEREMIAYRHLIQSGVSVETLEAQLAILHELLEQARDRLETSPLSPAAALLSAALIMVREGLEAILILAAVIAFLVKAGRRDALPYVHVGWVAALGLGLATWVVASQVISISGANRELTEGVTALLAAAVLLYVGFWLHGKAYAQRWQHFIATRVRGALTGRTLWALALVSFLAVYREVFETVLFYQALWVQADPPGHAGIIAGFVGAVVVLTALAWLIFRYSVRLPLQWFFGTSSILLAVLAVVLVGKGVVALQEAGALSVDPVDGPSVPLLGIYPNLQVLALQAALLCLIAAGFAYTAYAARHHP